MRPQITSAHIRNFYLLSAISISGIRRLHISPFYALRKKSSGNFSFPYCNSTQFMLALCRLINNFSI